MGPKLLRELDQFATEIGFGQNLLQTLLGVGLCTLFSILIANGVIQFNLGDVLGVNSDIFGANNILLLYGGPSLIIGISFGIWLWNGRLRKPYGK